jgi:hypothetical protein
MANPRRVLDIIGKYESDPVGGYQAVNQIGVAGGRGVLGYSGDIRKMKQHGGRPLTDMTVGEIMNLQKDTGISNPEWINKGKLHAVGRYQFIGPTLRERVSKLKIDPSQKFTPELQDKLALDYIKEAGSISPWIGPSDKATAAERADISAFLKNPNQPIAPIQQKDFKPDLKQQTVTTQATQLPGQPININLIVPGGIEPKETKDDFGSQFLKYYIGKGLETPQMSTGLKIDPIALLTQATFGSTNYFS